MNAPDSRPRERQLEYFAAGKKSVLTYFNAVLTFAVAVESDWGSDMKALRLIDGASYGPDALKAISEAFDEAWLAIADNCGNDPHDIERARLRLANALLSIASEESRNVVVLKTTALEAMVLAYRKRLAVETEYHGTAHSFFESQTWKR